MNTVIRAPETIREDLAALAEKERKEEARHHAQQQQLKENLNHLPWVKQFLVVG